MTIKAILFDIDGTLVDSNDLHIRAWIETFKTVGEELDAASIHEQIGKGSDLLVPALMPGADDVISEKLGKIHGEIFKHNYLQQVKAFPGARDLLVRAHEEGCKVVFATSASKGELEYYLG